MLSEQVADHFREASGTSLNQLAVYNPTPLVSDKPVEHKIELDKMNARKQAMVALKSAYGGATWSNVGLNVRFGTALAINPVSPNVIYAGSA